MNDINNIRGNVIVVYSDGHTETVFSGSYIKALEYQRKMLKSIRRRHDIAECRVDVN